MPSFTLAQKGGVMDTRKIIKSVAAGETLTHKGDITIEGDVSEKAVVTVEDGTLVIAGNVKAGAQVNLVVSEELRKKLSTVNKNKFYQGISATSASQSGNTEIFMDNVNIGDRILTDDKATTHGDGRYIITPISDDPSGALLAEMNQYISINGVSHKSYTVYGRATATIDGRQYQGKEIVVDPQYNVFVDGKNVTKAAKNANKPLEMPKLMIQGNIEDTAKIESDADVDVQGVIGSQCQVRSKLGKISAHNVLSDSYVKANGAVSVDDIASDVSLTSNAGSIL